MWSAATRAEILTLAFRSTEGKRLTCTEGELLLLHTYCLMEECYFGGLNIQGDAEEQTQPSVSIRDIQRAS